MLAPDYHLYKSVVMVEFLYIPVVAAEVMVAFPYITGFAEVMSVLQVAVVVAGFLYRLEVVVAAAVVVLGCPYIPAVRAHL